MDNIYPIGSIHLTTNNVNPSVYFGGEWEQITDDAYLKIVSSNPGTLSGTSKDHKIPLASIPSHKHGLYVTTNMSQGAGQNRNVVVGGGGAWSWNDERMQARGNGEPYYPYYYGIYVWKRTK